MVAPATTLETGSALAEDLDRLFKAQSDLDCVVMVSSGRPSHLLTREHYYAVTGGPYGFTLYQKKPVEVVAKAAPLIVEESMPVRQLARLALSRPASDQYDPVLVIDGKGLLRGVVTIRQLILRSAELEVQIAQLSNPLTSLPGSRMVQEWIARGLAEDRDGGLTVVFVDLDRFKEYNDVYGLLAGDELVRRTAAVLAECLDHFPPGTRLAHPGGDDFVLVSPRPVSTDVLREICARFDREKLGLFPSADLQRGGFITTDDRGNPVQVPLTTLSLAVINSRMLREGDGERHPAIFSQLAASLRGTAKIVTAAIGRSGFVANDFWQVAG
jgi:GGDEF domain-containing protein